jgi:hypothetical protein
MKKLGPRARAHAQSGLMVLTTLGGLRRAAFVTKDKPPLCVRPRPHEALRQNGPLKLGPFALPLVQVRVRRL